MTPNLVTHVGLTSEQLNIAVENKFITLDESHYPNSFLILKSQNKKDKTCLARVDTTGLQANLLPEQYNISGITPRNKEQMMLLDLLLDPEVRIVVATGKTGSGKSLVSVAAALHQIEKKKYKQIIVTKNMTQVTKGEIGYLPGGIDEKYIPFNGGVLSSLDFLGAASKKSELRKDWQDFYNIEFIPSTMIRGYSFNNSLIIVDEAQNMTNHELLTVGTRVSEGSKIIILGDLNQIDTNSKKSHTGLFKLINDSKVLESEVTGTIELLKSERGIVAEIFSNVFDIE